MLDTNTTLFLEAIKPLKNAYSNIHFNYLAVKQGSNFFLLQGRVFLNAVETEITTIPFKSQNIIAGQVTLAELKIDIDGFINQLMTGSISLLPTQLIFPKAGVEPFSTYYTPFHPEGIQSQQRINTLIIRGENGWQFIKQPMLDWEVMAAEQPYHSLQSLAYEYKLGVLESNNVNVEIAALPVAAIHASKSYIKGTTANVTLAIAEGLSTKEAALGYNIIKQSKVAERSRIPGDKIRWAKIENAQHGLAELAVPKGSVVQCFASYAGLTQNYFWLEDSSSISNARRAVFETFDNNLTTLKEVINNLKGRQDARDLESAVAWLLWMLGFNMLHFGKIIQEADLIAATPKGNYAVIECTRGLLHTDKLSKLYDRTEAVRRNLKKSGHHMLNVLPVIVTSKTKDEVSLGIENAEKYGILVQTREDLDAAINNRLIIDPNPDQLYKEALQTVRSAQARYQKQIESVASPS